MDNTTQYPTIPELVDAGLAKNPSIACSVKRGGKWIDTSVEDFKEQIEAFAFGLYGLGVRKGHKVALHAENSTEWVIIDQAILRLGAVTVPIYTTQPPNQIEYILSNAEAHLYIVSTEKLFASQHSLMQEEDKNIKPIGILGSFAPGMETFHDILEKGRKMRTDDPDLVARVQGSINANDLATLIYTSGTTGVPKGVMVTHASITYSVLTLTKRLPFDKEAHRGSAMISYLPLSHSLERSAAFLYLSIGCAIHFVEDYQEIAEDFKTVRPIHMATVPRLLEKVHAAIHNKIHATKGLKGVLARWALSLAEKYDVTINNPGPLHRLADRLVYKKLRDTVFGGNLIALTSGGAALSNIVMSFFNGIGIFCGQGYGLTETTPVISFYKKGELKQGSIGTPVEGMEVRIAEDGEIMARGPNVMQGYYKLPEATREAIEDDGWFHTGDIGKIDEDGHLYITDRKKQLFKLSTGKYIAPTPIETALCHSPFIEQAVVVGSECKFCAALLVLDRQAVHQDLGDNPTPTAIKNLTDTIVENVNRELPGWEQIKQYAVLDAPFTIENGELTPTMKLKRRIIHEKYNDEINALYD